MREVEICGKMVGDDHPTFVIAEAGSNHDRSVETACKLIDVSADCGADAVKFQTYVAELSFSTRTTVPQHYRERCGFDETANMCDLMKYVELSREQHAPVIEHCAKRDISFFSSVFDMSDVDFLETFDVPAYKIASYEISHFPLLKRVAETGKPVVLSTGMATLGEAEKALNILAQNGLDDVVLLHCISNYPALPEDSNLRAINTLKAAFGVPVGLSDHSPGVDVAKLAIAVGADMVEKHITLDQNSPGPDHPFSINPEELKALVEGARYVETVLGDGRKVCRDAEQGMRSLARRSVVADIEIPKGTRITSEMLVVRRPGTGLHPENLDVVIGSVARKDILDNEPLQWDMLIERDQG